MKFIVLLLIFGMNRYWVGTHPLYREEWVARMVEWLSTRAFMEDVSPSTRLALILGLPALLVLIVFWLVREWLFGIVWMAGAVCIVGFSVDISKVGTRLQEHLQWLKGIKPTENLGEANALHRRLKGRMIYEEFEGLYPQAFWFFLVGPAGALFYRVARWYSQRDTGEGSDSSVSAEDVVQMLEWIPARIHAIGFAVVGNFGSTVGGWVNSLGDWRTPTEDNLADLAESSIEKGGKGEQEVTQFILQCERDVFDLRDLLNRTLIFWLVLLALLVLLGWS